MATMKEIAALAQVSTATVSHVLSGKRPVSEPVRQRVLDAIAQTNYTPNVIAKSLRMNKTQTIGVLVEDISAFPVPEIVDGISEYLEENGYQLILNNLRLLGKLFNQYEQIGNYKDALNQGVRLMTNAQVDGIIYVAMHDRRIDKIIEPVNKPMVYAYAYSSNAREPSITYNNEESAYRITRLLLEQGHRRIALIAGHASSPPAKLRLMGYRKAMDEAGVHVYPEYIRWGDWAYASGLAEAEKLLCMTLRPTAIFAMNDLMAAGCYAAIQARGLRIPKDLSVAGFDNREIASYLIPGLTTVALPNKRIGYRSARTLHKRLMNDEILYENEILGCDVVERQSVAPPQ